MDHFPIKEQSITGRGNSFQVTHPSDPLRLIVDEGTSTEGIALDMTKLNPLLYIILVNGLPIRLFLTVR